MSGPADDGDVTQAALELAQRLGADDALLANLFNSRGIALGVRGRRQESIAHFREALAAGPRVRGAGAGAQPHGQPRGRHHVRRPPRGPGVRPARAGPVAPARDAVRPGHQRAQRRHVPAPHRGVGPRGHDRGVGPRGRRPGRLPRPCPGGGHGAGAARRREGCAGGAAGGRGLGRGPSGPGLPRLRPGRGVRSRGRRRRGPHPRSARRRGPPHSDDGPLRPRLATRRPYGARAGGPRRLSTRCSPCWTVATTARSRCWCVPSAG